MDFEEIHKRIQIIYGGEHGIEFIMVQRTESSYRNY